MSDCVFWGLYLFRVCIAHLPIRWRILVMFTHYIRSPMVEIDCLLIILAVFSLLITIQCSPSAAACRDPGGSLGLSIAMSLFLYKGSVWDWSLCLVTAKASLIVVILGWVATWTLGRFPFPLNPNLQKGLVFLCVHIGNVNFYLLEGSVAPPARFSLPLTSQLPSSLTWFDGQFSPLFCGCTSRKKSI